MKIFSPFIHEDFAANPAKYALFKTAIVITNVITHDGENDLERGTIVGVRHVRNAWNALRRREEPIYAITKDGEHWGMLYANALADFTL